MHIYPVLNQIIPLGRELVAWFLLSSGCYVSVIDLPYGDAGWSVVLYVIVAFPACYSHTTRGFGWGCLVFTIH